MRALVQTIRFKTIAAMGTCTALILFIGVFGVASVYELNQNVKSSYTETTLPILDLENVRVAVLDVRLRLGLVQALRDAGTTRTAGAQINADLAAIDKAWPDYYPAHVSTVDERAVADKIKDNLAQLKINTIIICITYYFSPRHLIEIFYIARSAHSGSTKLHYAPLL